MCIRMKYGVPNWNAKIKNSNLKTTAFQISVRVRPFIQQRRGIAVTGELVIGTPVFLPPWRLHEAPARHNF